MWIIIRNLKDTCKWFEILFCYAVVVQIFQGKAVVGSVKFFR